MKRQSLRAIVLAVVAILFTAYGFMSYNWYSEERVDENRQTDEVIRSVYGYGIRGVTNVTEFKYNGSVNETVSKDMTYDEFIGLENSRAGGVAANMIILMIVALVLTIIFIPMVKLSSEGKLEDKLGKIGPFLPIILGQIAVLILIIGPLWYSYAFITGIEADLDELHQGQSQALGEKAGLWVIFGGVLLQFGVTGALARTKLIYIEPLKGKGTGPG